MDVGPEEWVGVTMENGRVVKLELREVGLTGAVPAEIGQLTSLRSWTSRQPADELAGGDRAAHLADGLDLDCNQLTSVPAEIGQLTSLKELYLATIS